MNIGSRPTVLWRRIPSPELYRTQDIDLEDPPDQPVLDERDAATYSELVQAHAPLALGCRSRPEPDVCVVRGSPRDYRSAAPTAPALVLEVSHTSLALDRARKASIYARAGIPDYSIVNLVDQVVEVHRDPVRLELPRRGWAYRSAQMLQRGASTAPLAAPNAPVAVADLLP